MPSAPGSAQSAGGTPWKSKARHVFPVLAVAAFCAWAVYPAILAYTFAAGEKATATVAECETSWRGAGECRGTWRTESGERGEGEIYNLDTYEADGKTLPVRIGPLGPYAHGWDRAWLGTVLSAVAPIVLLGGYWLIDLKVFRPGRAIAAGLLTAPGALVVTDGKARRPDGAPHVLVQNLPEAPPGHRRLDLPGRAERHDEWSGKKGEHTYFQSVVDADERPLMLLEHRSGDRLEPETVLLDPSGTPRLLIRRIEGTRFRLLDPSGTELGSAAPTKTGRITNLEVWDADEKLIAQAAARGLMKWVLRVEEDAPPLLRDAALALAFVQLRVY